MLTILPLPLLSLVSPLMTVHVADTAAQVCTFVSNLRCASCGWFGREDDDGNRTSMWHTHQHKNENQEK